MPKHWLVMNIIFGHLLVPMGVAVADCTGQNAAKAEQHYLRARSLMQQQRAWEAINAFDQALAPTCDTPPVWRHQAAMQVANLGETHGAALVREQRIYNADAPQKSAFHWYELGGHFAKSDQLLVSSLNQNPEDIQLSTFAINHFSHRALSGFRANQSARIQAAGHYQLDPLLMQQVRQNPARQIQRLLTHADQQLSEAYLRSMADTELMPLLIKPGDPQAMIQTQQQVASFHQRWPNNQLKEAERDLDKALAWMQLVHTPNEREPLAAQRRAQLKKLAFRLTRVEKRSPQLLQTAIDFYLLANDNKAVTKTKQLASTEGLSAQNAEHFQLASALYRVARQLEQAEFADRQAEQQQQATTAVHMSQWQPQHMSPEMIKALQTQALELQRKMHVNPNTTEQQDD